MRLHRRELLSLAGAGLLGTLASRRGLAAQERQGPAPSELDVGDWESVRALFELDPSYLHFAGMLLASHPRPVQEALEGHRRALDENPTLYLLRNNRRLEAEVRRAAARYLGARYGEVALTDSTTMGLGLVYNGVRVRKGQELLSTEGSYYSTRKSLEFKARQSGARLRQVPLPEDLQRATEASLASRVLEAVRPRTRVVALTWVHSSTGLKLPIQRIAAGLAKLNARREPGERALLCVDGVHALGVEDFTVRALGCDFLMAGTHKWLFGPRGTGFIWGHPRAHAQVQPTIPSFSPRDDWGGRMTPGGFHSFEHRWALTQAFELHLALGKARVTERIHALARQLKEGLAALPHVTLRTPLDAGLSAGIVCFEVKRQRPQRVVSELRERGIIATVTPQRPYLARLTPGLLNTPEQVEQALQAVRALG